MNSCASLDSADAFPAAMSDSKRHRNASDHRDPPSIFLPIDAHDQTRKHLPLAHGTSLPQLRRDATRCRLGGARHSPRRRASGRAVAHLACGDLCMTPRVRRWSVIAAAALVVIAAIAYCRVSRVALLQAGTADLPRSSACSATSSSVRSALRGSADSGVRRHARCPALHAGATAGPGLLPARQRRQPADLDDRHRLLPACELRPVHSRLPRLRQEHRARSKAKRNCTRDVRAAWDAIAPRYRGKPIVIYGRSLGTGLAAKLASEVDAQLLVLVSPYSSLARCREGGVPARAGMAAQVPAAHRSGDWPA